MKAHRAQRAFALLSRLSEAVHAADVRYHAGAIDSHAVYVRTCRLERRRQAVREITLRPFFAAGDRVVAKWGEVATITGFDRQGSSSGGGLLYRVLRGEVNDLWPAEVVVSLS